MNLKDLLGEVEADNNWFHIVALAEGLLATTSLLQSPADGSGGRPHHQNGVRSMVKAARRGFAPVNGGLECGQRQPSVYGSADGIAYHAPRPGIENDGNIDEVTGNGDVGDVCHPELVRAVRDDLGGKIGEDRLIVMLSVVAMKRRRVLG